MPGLYEADQVGQRQEISNEVFNIRADETPFVSLAKKDPKPKKKVATWQVETFRDGSLGGVMDGADVDSFNSQGRELLTGVCQKFREPWFVSDFADETEVAGLPTGEKGRQKMVAAKVLKYSLEGRSLSILECSTDNGTDTPNATRGVFRWLQATAQTVYPVPAAFRPASACIHSGALSTLTESTFEAQLAAAFKARKGKLNLDGFVGITLKQKFDNWTARDPEASAANYPVRVFRQEAGKKAMVKCVDFFDFSTGQVRLHLSTYLYKNADGSDSDYTHRSGAFLDMNMWSIGFLGDRRPRMVELPDLGGGPRGFSDCIAVVKCLNPLGQVVVIAEE